MVHYSLYSSQMAACVQGMNTNIFNENFGNDGSSKWLLKRSFKFHNLLDLCHLKKRLKYYFSQIPSFHSNFYCQWPPKMFFVIVPHSFLTTTQMWKGLMFRTGASVNWICFLLFVSAHCSNEWEHGLGSSLRVLTTGWKSKGRRSGACHWLTAVLLLY